MPVSGMPRAAAPSSVIGRRPIDASHKPPRRPAAATIGNADDHRFLHFVPLALDVGERRCATTSTNGSRVERVRSRVHAPRARRASRRSRLRADRARRRPGRSVEAVPVRREQLAAARRRSPRPGPARRPCPRFLQPRSDDVRVLVSSSRTTLASVAMHAVELAVDAAQADAALLPQHVGAERGTARRAAPACTRPSGARAATAGS